MTFLTRRRNDFLSLATDTSVGKRPSLSESLATGYKDSSVLQSAMGDADIFSTFYKENLEKAEQLSGEKFDYISDQFSYRYIAKGFSGEQLDKPPLLLDFFQQQDAQLKKLKGKYPEVKTTKEVWESAKSGASSMEANVAMVREKQSGIGVVADFVGGMAGSFTMSDPLNQLTFGIGGFGKSLAAKVATESVAASAIESINQFVGVPDSRRRLGLRESTLGEKAMNVALAGAGAGVIRGAIEVAPGAYRALEQKVAPQRAFARKVRDAVGGEPTPGFKPRSLSNEDYLFYLKTTAAKTSLNRAIVHGLELEIERNNKPLFGGDPESLLLQEKALADFGYKFETGSDRSSLMSSASSQKIDIGDGTFVDPDAVVPDVINFYEAEARANNPQVFESYEIQKTVVDDLQRQVTEIDDRMNSRTLADSIEALDAETGQRVKSIEAELENVTSRQRRQELEKELDMVVSNLSEAEITKADNDFRIGPKRQRQNLTKKLSAEKKKLNSITKSRAVEIDKVISTKKALGSLSVPNKKPNNRSGISDAPIENIAKAGDAAYKRVMEARGLPEAENKASAEKKPTNKSTKQKEPGFIEVGGVKIPDDFEVAIGATLTEDGAAPVMMRARDILNEIAEEEKMIEAMKVCGL